MKFDWKNAAKGTGMAVLDIGLVTGGAIASNQFMDLQRIFKNADPNGFFIKHQGGVKAVGSALAVGLFSKQLPGWAKMLLIGVGVGGAIKEFKVLSGGKIEAVGGNGNGSGADTSRLDALLEQAAQRANAEMGNAPTEFPSNVGSPSAELMNDSYTTVGQLVPGMGANGSMIPAMGADNFGRW